MGPDEMLPASPKGAAANGAGKTHDSRAGENHDEVG